MEGHYVISKLRTRGNAIKKYKFAIMSQSQADEAVKHFRHKAGNLQAALPTNVLVIPVTSSRY